MLAGELFLRMMNKHGVTSVGIKTLRLFHGFISDWLEGIASPLEDILEDMSVPTNASVCLLRFAQNSEIQGLIVVSDIHPGPFKNVGSSNIPFEIQKALGFKSLVIVPHGASGHERDLPSAKYCRRLIDSIVETHEFGNISGTSSCMVRRDLGDAHASCQFLGDVAVVTLTCAPQSMEDIPFEVGTTIVEKGKVLGAKDVVVIDAHNSVGNANEVPILSHKQLVDLKSASESAIMSALKLKRNDFRFGASRIVPKEFKIEEGFGPGGISVAVIEVNNQKVAYVTIDGNNMVIGLREEIRNVLKGMVNESEVLATDTHIVNAISTIQRGYHPVGEMGNREALLSYVSECTSKAISQLQESTVSYNRIDVPELYVIGEEKLKSLSLLIDSSVRLLKHLALLIYVPTIILVIVLFLLL
jgi:putative membrane protein